MFEALGFQEIDTGNRNWLIRFDKLIRKNNDSDDYKTISLSFWVESKIYDATDWGFYDNSDTFGARVDVPLHLAIAQQMKELGWIEWNSC